jgi:hypothetical protein
MYAIYRSASRNRPPLWTVCAAGMTIAGLLGGLAGCGPKEETNTPSSSSNAGGANSTRSSNAGSANGTGQTGLSEPSKAPGGG